jgi:hypothetical protein
MNLSYFELLGDASMLNKEMELYNKVNRDDIMTQSKVLFNEKRCSTLYYASKP